MWEKCCHDFRQKTVLVALCPGTPFQPNRVCFTQGPAETDPPPFSGSRDHERAQKQTRRHKKAGDVVNRKECCKTSKKGYQECPRKVIRHCSSLLNSNLGSPGVRFVDLVNDLSHSRETERNCFVKGGGSEMEFIARIQNQR